MPYLMTYKGKTIFNNDNKYYCFTNSASRSIDYESLAEIKKAIDENRIEYSKIKLVGGTWHPVHTNPLS